MILYGTIPNDQVRNILVKGQIFINPSLTEAFCISNLEAASCGLLVVSNNVGGVKEVLPPDMMIMADCSPEGFIKCVNKAIEKVDQYPQVENWN